MDFDMRPGRISDLIAPLCEFGLPRRHGVMASGFQKDLLPYSGLRGNEGVVLAPATIIQGVIAQSTERGDIVSTFDQALPKRPLTILWALRK